MSVPFVTTSVSYLLENSVAPRAATPVIPVVLPFILGELSHVCGGPVWTGKELLLRGAFCRDSFV